jgi:TPR repeat protein
MGSGVTRDYALAVTWFLKSDAQGNMCAPESLGRCYESGNGVVADASKAFTYYKSSAERGFLPGMIQLGRCYANGIGVSKDVSKAIACYKAAFRRGDYSANATLAYYYRYGNGVPKDEIEAYGYLSLAADKFPEARKELDSLGATLGPEQLSAGQRRAKEMHSEVEAAKESKPLEYR